MITLIDNTVGEVEAKFKEIDIAENTMLVFVSDNGPHNEGGHDVNFFDSNGIYRGYKRDLYEGGIRVPLIIKWPQKVKPNTVSTKPVATWDLLPTFAEMVRAPKPSDIDGVSILPTLLGDEGQQEDHPYFYWEFYEEGGRQAIRVGNWKYIKFNLRNASEPVVTELYNLADDPSEENNLIISQKQKAVELDSLIVKAHVEHKILSLLSNTEEK